MEDSGDFQKMFLSGGVTNLLTLLLFMCSRSCQKSAIEQNLQNVTAVVLLATALIKTRCAMPDPVKKTSNSGRSPFKKMLEAVLQIV